VRTDPIRPTLRSTKQISTVGPRRSLPPPTLLLTCRTVHADDHVPMCLTQGLDDGGFQHNGAAASRCTSRKPWTVENRLTSTLISWASRRSPSWPRSRQPYDNVQKTQLPVSAQGPRQFRSSTANAATAHIDGVATEIRLSRPKSPNWARKSPGVTTFTHYIVKTSVLMKGCPPFSPTTIATRHSASNSRCGPGNIHGTYHLPIDEAYANIASTPC